METFFPGSISSAYFRSLPPEKTVDFFADNNIFYAELAHEHAVDLIARAEKTGESRFRVGQNLRAYAKEKGFTIPQGHLSFLPGEKGGLLAEGHVDLLKKELELFEGIGIENAVIHVSAFPDLEERERHERVLPILADLLAEIKGTKMCICIENLFKNADVRTADEIFVYLDELNSENLGICMDTGHLHMSRALGIANQTQREFILRAGDKLKALHIANNDGFRDQHLLPFNNSRSIHWDEVVRSLVEIGYKGIFNLEIGGEHSSITCPFAVRMMKLEYIRKLLDYMLSDEFLNWQGN